MKGLMYIAGSFHTVRRSACGGGKGWIDNDPHFWTDPPTWGICRNDLRRKADLEDYVFFVLPRAANHPQCLFGYMKVKEKITHLDAFSRPYLRSKRMGNKNPNGNIIVTATGAYNRFDANAHRHMFDRVKLEYVIGHLSHSRILSVKDINRLAPNFMALLRKLFGTSRERPIDYISRYGRILNEKQVNQVLSWANG